jgi:PAS domain-containing protein
MTGLGHLGGSTSLVHRKSGSLPSDIEELGYEPDPGEWTGTGGARAFDNAPATEDVPYPAARQVETMPSLRHDNLGGVGLVVLLAQFRDTVAFVDASGRVLLTNRAVAAGTPESRDGMDLGAAAVRFRPDGQRYESRALPVMRSVRSGEVVRDEECVRLEAGGARQSLSCRSAPIRDDAGAIVARR